MTEDVQLTADARETINLQHHGSWKMRRLVMFVIGLFCMATVCYILATGVDTEPAETAMTMSYLTLIVIVCVYVFGAVIDDKNILDKIR